MSPPSRNQVTNVPKPRPPSPHSLRCSLSSAARQRAAAKPTRVTTTNRAMTMVKAMALPLMSAHLPRAFLRAPWAGCRVAPLCQPAEHVGGGGQDRDDRHPHELVPVEEREPPERRSEVVVERHPQRPDQGGCQHDCYHDPGADVLACGTGLGHHDLFLRWSSVRRGRPMMARPGALRRVLRSGAYDAVVPRWAQGITVGDPADVRRWRCGCHAAPLPRYARLIL